MLRNVNTARYSLSVSETVLRSYRAPLEREQLQAAQKTQPTESRVLFAATKQTELALCSVLFEEVLASLES
jgi:hypothetical protein